MRPQKTSTHADRKAPRPPFGTTHHLLIKNLINITRKSVNCRRENIRKFIFNFLSYDQQRVLHTVKGKLERMCRLVYYTPCSFMPHTVRIKDWVASAVAVMATSD